HPMNILPPWRERIRPEQSDEAALLEAKLDVEQRAALLAEWRRRLEAADNTHDVGMCRYQLKRATRALAKAQTELADLEKEFEMRRTALSDSPASMRAPGEGWKLVANRALNISGISVRRGQEITDEMMQCANIAQMIVGGHVVWRAPHQAAKTAPTP